MTGAINYKNFTRYCCQGFLQRTATEAKTWSYAQDMLVDILRMTSIAIVITCFTVVKSLNNTTFIKVSQSELRTPCQNCFFFQMWIPKNARCMPNIVMYWFYVLIVPCIIFSPRFERDKLFLFLDKFPTSASKGRLDNYLWLLGAVACSLHQSRGILTASCWSHNRTMWVGIEFEEMCCRHKCW